jgi:ubiquinone/menaquinone biosynthesis C-methylase UbiE
MYPFYYFAYRGRNIRQVMDFKKQVWSFSPADYAHFYNNLNSISRNRATDLNHPCLEFILEHLAHNTANLLDVGCGHGYLLKKIQEQHPHIARTGFDIKEPEGNEPFTYVKGNIEQLPFADNAFDVVVTSHTVEHLLNLPQCIAELVRVTRKQLFIITPCQRYYYYTLDEHVNFFTQQEHLTRLLPFTHFECSKLNGDWMYVGRK